jgi:hypothetical protein
VILGSSHPALIVGRLRWASAPHFSSHENYFESFGILKSSNAIVRPERLHARRAPNGRSRKVGSRLSRFVPQVSQCSLGEGARVSEKHKREMRVTQADRLGSTD